MDEIYKKIKGRTIRVHILGGSAHASLLTIVDEERAKFGSEITLHSYMDDTKHMILSGDVYGEADLAEVKELFPKLEVSIIGSLGNEDDFTHYVVYHREDW